MTNWTDTISWFSSEEADQLFDDLDPDAMTPDPSLIFQPFEFFDFEQTRVVMIGDGLYDDPNLNDGLAYSATKAETIPPILDNILWECHYDYGRRMEGSSLAGWAEQGVLLLNTRLSDTGDWNGLIVDLIEQFNKGYVNVFFLLIGDAGAAYKPQINTRYHERVTVASPAPDSAYRGFYGSRPFSKINTFLKNQNLGRIYWDHSI